MPTLILIAGIGVVILSRPEFGLAIALALAPFTNLQIGSGASFSAKPLHLLLPALVFGLLAYALLVPNQKRPLGLHWLSAAVICFLAVALASALNALDAHSSVNKLFLLLTAVGAFFAVREICVERRQLVVIVAGAITGLLLASLQGIDQHVRHQYGVAGFVSVTGHFVGRVQGSFGHPNQYGGYLVVLIPLAAAVVFTRKFDGRLRLLAAAALAAAVPALVFSFARGAILALVLGLLIWFAVVRPRYAIAVAAFTAAVAVLFAPATLKERFSPQVSSGDVPLRTDIWGASLDIAQGHPFLGVGVGNFSKAYAALPSTLSHASQRRLLNQSGLLIPPHAQNLFLNVLAEEGWLGIAALTFFGFGAVAVAYRGSKARDPVGRAICIGLGGGLVTLALHSVLEVTLLSELSVPLFALLAVALAVVGLDQADRELEQVPG